MIDDIQLAQAYTTIKFVYRNSNGLVYNTSSTAYESWTDANYNAGKYGVAATQQGTSKYWTVQTPAVVAQGQYSFVVMNVVDGTITDDQPVGSGNSGPVVANVYISNG